MAKSKSFFGLRKGSTKTHTYSVLDGQQITKDRVYDVKNPRTVGQMRQRMLMTTVGAAYKFMKAIADHSFEGKSSGMQCMREFNSRNLNRFKAAASADGSVAFNEYKDGQINPLPFILAKGSLPTIPFKLNNESKLEVKYEKEDADFATAEGIYTAMGVQKGDLITFCSVIGEGGLVKGVFDYTPNQFNIVRLVCDHAGAVSTPLEAFTVSNNNEEAIVTVETSGNAITFTSSEADFGAVIMSRKSNQTWLRSDAVMVVAADLIKGVKTANQLATYPVGSELILNNGPMQNQGEGGATALPAPTLSFAQATIQANGNSNVQAPQLNGIPSGASVTYTSQDPGIASVNPSTGEITPRSNGTTTIIARTSATEEFGVGTASFTVEVSGIVEAALAISPTAATFNSTNTTQKVTFANEGNNDVTVSVVSGSGVTYSVASDKKSVTFTCDTVSNSESGVLSIKVGTATARFTWEYKTNSGSMD